MRLVQSGPRKTNIMIVGEAPGDTETATGVPFAGASGELLNRMLSQAKILRQDCFVTNLCHEQPRGSKKNDFNWFLKTAEGQAILLQGMLQLKADIESIRPNLVIALGAMPLRVLTGKHGIEKWRGSILESTLVAGQKVIGTIHPAAALRTYEYKAVAEMDLRRCASDSRDPKLNLPQRTFYLNPQGSQRREIMAEMLDAEWLGTDIECWEDDKGVWRLACCGFSDRADRALVIHNYGDQDLRDIETLTSSPVPKVFQNGQFDVTVLEEMNSIRVRGYGEHIYSGDKLTAVSGWDTMLAHHALYPECAGGSDEYSANQKGGNKRTSAAIKKGLGFLVSINTREPFYKDDGKVWKETNDLQMFWRYNALDAACTREIRDVQADDLASFGTFSTFQHEMSLQRVLMGCTKRGIPVDVGSRLTLKREIEHQLSALQIYLDSGAGKHINVFSNGVNGDVGKLIYGDLGLKPKINRDTGNPTADKDAIIELAAKRGHPLLLTILSIRERRKIIETYLDTKLDSDGRMRCSYDPTGTRTGRLASRASIFGSGQNLQNQPDKIRRTFVSGDGYVFIEPDYSQAEARVVAYLAREQELIDLFEDPSRDVHTENASRIYGCDPSAVTPEMRYTAKRGTHSANYGVGADKTMMVINQDAKDTWGKSGTGITVSLSDSRRIVEGYFALYPRIKSIFWAEVVNQLKRDRTLTGVFGRRRTFFARWESSDDSKFLNAAYSYIPQNAVGDLCTMAMVAMDKRLTDAVLLANVHDSILVHCPDDLATIEKTIDQMQECMRIPLTVHGRTFYIPSEMKIGRNWGKKAKDGSNPHGLEDAHKWLESHASLSTRG